MMPSESTLQQTRRHLREGAARIEAQLVLIVRLHDGGHERLRARALRLLAVLEDVQEQGHRLLRQEEAAWGVTPPSASAGGWVFSVRPPGGTRGVCCR